MSALDPVAEARVLSIPMLAMHLKRECPNNSDSSSFSDRHKSERETPSVLPRLETLYLPLLERPRHFFLRIHATTTIGKASKMADYRDERNTTSPLPTAKISHGRFKNAKLNKIDSKGRHGGVKKSTSKCTQPVARPSTPRAYATPQDTMDTESNTEVREAAAMAAAAKKRGRSSLESLLRGIQETNPPDHPLLRPRCIRPEWD